MLLLRKQFSVVLVVGMCASVVSGGILEDSGWTAMWAGDDISVFVEGVTDTSVTLRIDKSLESLGFGQLPTATIIFVQTDPAAVDKIIIASENVLNDSGIPWDGYRWVLTPSSKVSFNQQESNWNYPPFGGAIWDPDPSSDWLTVGNTGLDENFHGDTVMPGEVFSPNGSLVIDVNTQLGSSVVFGFKQIAVPYEEAPVPEPATMMTMVLVGAGALIRRRRRRSAGPSRCSAPDRT